MNTTNGAQVTFFLTIYNESESVTSVLESLKNIPLPSGITSYSVYAVDDASTDDTPHVLRVAQAEHPLHIERYETNQGVPETFKRGLQYLAKTLSDDDIVVLMEADGTSDPSVVPLMLEKILSGKDIVISQRDFDGGAYINFPWYRVLGSRTINLFLRLLWRVKGVHDYTIFFRAYRVAILKKCFTHDFKFLARKSFAANGEILLRLKKFAPQIDQVPLRYDYGLKKGPSRMKLLAALIEYLRITFVYYFVNKP